jgi:predicted component of type VI protein secretion system
VEGGAIIGRSPDAGWCLSDPERIVSKAHCRIDAEPHGFVLTDISTNGTLVNGEAVGFEQKRLLADGDRLRIGKFEVAVAVEKAEAASSPGAGTMPDGPFGNADTDPLKPERTTDAPAPAGAQPVAGAMAAGEPIKEDWWIGPQPALPEDPAQDVDSVNQTLISDKRSVLTSAQPISPTDAIVISLVQSFPSLDVLSLASAVDTAGALMPEDEWQRFYKRLRAFLQERHPDDRQDVAG